MPKNITCLISGFLHPSGIILIGLTILPYLWSICASFSFFTNGGTFDKTTFLEGLDKGNTGTKVSLIINPVSIKSSTIWISVRKNTVALFIREADLILAPPTAALTAFRQSSTDTWASGMHLQPCLSVNREKSPASDPIIPTHWPKSGINKPLTNPILNRKEKFQGNKKSHSNKEMLSPTPNDSVHTHSQHAPAERERGRERERERERPKMQLDSWACGIPDVGCESSKRALNVQKHSSGLFMVLSADRVVQKSYFLTGGHRSTSEFHICWFPGHH